MNTIFKKYKYLLFTIGLISSILLAGKDTNYWGVLEKGGGQILADIANGVAISKDVVLTKKQKKEIEDLIESHPERYNTHQKALISKKTGAEILEEVKNGKLIAGDVYLNKYQNNEITILIDANPDKYNNKQTYLIRVKAGEEILREIGNGLRNPVYMKLTPTQLDEVKELIEKNPEKYNDNQKLLIK